MDNKFLTPEQIENLKEGEEMFVQLMQKAINGEQSKFEFIRSWSDRALVKQYINSVETVINIFVNLKNSTYKTYLDQVKTDTQDLGVILALKQFSQCKQFYENEVFIARDMLDEYKVYVWNGHIIDTLLGKVRPEEDLVDYRELPLSWF